MPTHPDSIDSHYRWRCKQQCSFFVAVDLITLCNIDFEATLFILRQ